MNTSEIVDQAILSQLATLIELTTALTERLAAMDEKVDEIVERVNEIDTSYGDGFTIS